MGLLPDDLLLRPWLPLPIIAVLVMSLAGLAAWGYLRERRDQPARRAELLGMRWLGLAALGVVLLGVSVMPEAGRVLDRPTLTVLVDTSGSMHTADTAAGSRLDLLAARWLTPENLRAGRQHAEVELLAFDADDRPRPLPPPREDAAWRGDATPPAPGQLAAGTSQGHSGGGETRLIDVVRHAVMRGDASRSAGVLVLSDGRDTTDAPLRPALQWAQRRGVPVHSVVVGGASLRRDVSVAAAVRPGRLIVGETGTLRVTVLHQGAAGQTLTLTVTRPDGTQRKQPVTLTAEPVTTVELPVTPQTPGLHAYRVAVDALPDEGNTDNNTQTTYAQVSPERLRTLLIEGQPHWDSKLLAHALRQDPRVEVTQLTQLAAQRREAITTRDDGDATLPDGDAGLADYDVVLLGRRVERVVTPAFMEQLAEAVRDEGLHLVLTRGLPVNPDTSDGRIAWRAIAPALPVRRGAAATWQPVTDASLTPSGRSHPAFVDQPGAEPVLVQPRGVQQGVDLQPAAVVLATGTTGAGGPLPYVVAQQAGRGRVVVVLGRGLWRTRLERGGERAAVFDGFWTRLVRAVALGAAYDPGQPATLRLSRNSVGLGEPVTAELLLRPGYAAQPAAAALIGPDGRRTPLALVPADARQRSGTFTPDRAGDHRVRVATPGLEPGELVAPLVVQRTDRELLNTAADPVPLRLLAEASGGQVLPPDGCDRVTELLRINRATLNAPAVPRYVWARLDVLCGLLTWLGLEWVLRRRMGLC